MFLPVPGFQSTIQILEIGSYKVVPPPFSLDWILGGGWALPLWKTMEFVSWDDDIPNICEKMFQTTNQDIYRLTAKISTFSLDFC